MHKVFIIIPTYCEAENIKKIIPEIENVFEKSNIKGAILIVDDNSPDGTIDLIKSFSKKYENLYLLLRPRKMGLGSAYRDGFNYILENFETEYIAEMDADGSHPPNFLPEMIYKLEKENADVVIASRYVKGGKIYGWNLRRKITSIGANLLARIFTRINIKDFTSGYRIYKTNVLKKINFSKASSSFAFQIEMVYNCIKNGFKIIEVPFTFIDRRIGKSKLKISEYFYFIFTLFKILLKLGE
ncbi:MAG: polyprenol monophosphomannose synthase [Nitrososphaerota archaeon]